MQPDAHIDDWANRYMQWIAGTKIKIFCFSQVWFSYILFLHWKNGGTLEWYGYTSNFCYPFLENMVRALGPSSFSIIVPAELSIATKTRCNNKMNLTICAWGNTPTYQDISSPKLVWNTMLPKRNFMDNKMIEDMLTSSEHVKLPVLSDQVMKN